MKNEWIDMNDRMPPFNQNVIGVSNKGRVVITFAEIDGQFSLMELDCHYEGDDEHFTHWMPLPEPPKP